MAALSAQSDEDWQDFNEFTAASDATSEPVHSEPEEPEERQEPGPEPEFSAFCWDVEDSVSGEKSSWSSAQDLVQEFEQKLSLCFRKNFTDTENISDIKPITEEHLLREDE